ncbi:proteasome activator complex subunit 4A [Megachile rotundata]|uniref:proteasome activator complex subunit 4A n=1 Tax=Megachile rotundata TaxID=143995 RepID=UPI003FD53246
MDEVEDLLYICDYKNLESIFFQKFIYNKLLPYSEDLGKESEILLAEIKANLGRAVIFHEVWPGCYIWVNKLCHYIKLYGLKFSKEDHILFIKLLFELITVPKIPSVYTLKCVNTLILLLIKKKLISPDELELPWRPLYEMCVRMKDTKGSRPEMYCYNNAHKVAMQGLIRCAKIYFPLSATQEILDELRPTLCPLNFPIMYKSLQMLRSFLPVQLPPKHHSIGYELWFDEFMALWEVCHNVPEWETKMMDLMASLANCNIGYINWEPYIPLMFTRFMQGLKLPVSYNKSQKYKHHGVDATSIAKWIVAVLGNKSSAQIHLEKFLKTIETYFHPVNNGWWLAILKEILLKLSFYFITRLNRERYAKLTWETPIPENYKLTDSDIDSFVKSMLPVTTVAMFNKLSMNEALEALQYLSSMRPNLVIPHVLEKISSTLDSPTTESYKLIAAMVGMEAIARPLAEGSQNINEGYTYSEGPTHILPLLTLLLPNIDPNDPEKCFLVFRLILVYASFIPIVDSSKSVTDEEERMNDEVASGFEDFILQFLDKIFSFIDYSSLESVRLENISGSKKSKLENLIESVFSDVCMVLLMQIKDTTFERALHKLRIFITERILEINVAGQLAGGLCRVFARVNGKETLRILLPVLSQTILSITSENNDITKEDNLDERLLHVMLLLSATVNTTGNNLLPHIETLTTVLDHVLILKSKEGNNLACMLLNTIFRSLSTMAPYHFESTDRIRYWAQILDINSLNVKWYIPGKEEMDVIKRIFSKYLLPEVSKLEEYCEDCSKLTWEELLISLNIVSNIIKGCESVLPMWEEEPLSLMESSLRWLPFVPTLGMKEKLLMPDNSNVKRYMVTLMSKLQDVILKNTDGGTKCLRVLVKIWSSLLLGTGSSFNMSITRYKDLKSMCRVMEDKLVKKKGLIGCCILLRAETQHATRSYLRIVNLTQTHKEIMLKLFILATSRYASIQCQARCVLSRAFQHIPFTWKIIVPKVLDILGEDPEENKEAYKGVLHILLDSQENPILMRHDWNTLRSLWSALVLSKPSEELSIIRLKNDLVKFINSQFSTVAITYEMSNVCLTISTDLWKTYPRPNLPQPCEDEITKGLKIIQMFNETNLASYKGLVSDLLNALLEKNLHWRHRLMALDFIRHLVHPEQIYPPEVVRYFVETLIHDSLSERNIAFRVVTCMLQQQKREHPKITIDLPISSKKDESEKDQCKKFILGQRPDNAWLQYNYETRPLTTEQWDEPRFIHQPYIGYYTWPKDIKVYAPSDKQPCLDPDLRQLTNHEIEIDSFFNNSENIKKLIKFYSLETKKDKDQFSKYLFFKGLFRNHGIVFLKHFLPHLEELVVDKQEGSQRCAAEIIAGIIKGSKHWPFNMVCEMWDSLLPIIKLALINLTPETTTDWVICFSKAQQYRDPNRQHWLLECLMEETCFGQSESSFIECGRLQTLRAVLMKQPWRVTALFRRLLKHIEDRLLANPFDNVRETLSSVLVSVFCADLRSSNTSRDQSLPQIQDFLNKIVPKLQPLVNDNAMKSNKELETLSEQISIVKLDKHSKNSEISEDEKQRSIRLLTTVCNMITRIDSLLFLLPPEFYQIFPIIYQLENCATDEELKKSCKSALAVYAQSFTLPRNVPVALEAIEKMSKHTSWWTRSACLELLQTWVFHNMGTLLSDLSWINCVKDIVLRLLEDERVEVRKTAGKVLSGLLHCTFIPDQECLLDEFKKKAKTKLYKEGRSKNISEDKKRILKTDAIRIRHAAVIGMCAFIQAHPYDVPKHIPPIFEHLSPHITDPQPIPMTIKKTLDDFKRTHGGWRNMKEYTQHFTEEQLTTLQDLMMPPSHYV